MNRPKKPILFLTAVFILFSGVTTSTSAQLVTTRIYIGNQGNFSDANGSVSIYTPGTGEVVTDGIPNLNTLVQSITIHEDTGYIVANTSDRIDVIDAGTGMRTGQITGIPGPRYLTVVGENKAYVSNLFDNTVTIIDTANNLVPGTISTGTNPEDIAVVGETAYVANNGFGFDSTLTKIDTSTDTVLETINLGCDGPRSLEVDGQDELWVFCNGKTVYNSDFSEIIEQTSGQVLVINPETDVIDQRFELDAQIGTASAGQDTFYDPVTDQIFVIQGSELLVFDTTTNTQLDNIMISGDEPVSGVAFDAADNQLYLTRITGFTTAGFVSIHDADGMEVSRFDAGIAPTSFALVQTGTSVASEDAGETPSAFLIHQNYPNPFNPSTTISFEAPVSMPVNVSIFNTLGQEVAHIFEGYVDSGLHRFSWDASRLPGGTYIYRISSENFSQTRGMTLIK